MQPSRNADAAGVTEASASLPEAVLEQAWLEEQAALYQARWEDPDPPNPVEFAARALLPREAARLGFDLRARLIQRLRILDRLRQALGPRARTGGDDLQVGDVIEDLEILEPIGKGGMGRVYRARQLSLGRVVALKTPHWAASLDPREKARFWREAQAIARLRHPGIVPLFAVGQRGGTPYLLLEYVEGLSLSEVIQRLRSGALPRAGASLGRPGVSFEHAAAGLVSDVLSALQAAHEAGIVHRDVKPGNVMLEASGRVRVLDFGLAKLQRDEALTRSREFLGTLQYTAPEILENPRGANAASDVYSAGALLYELLSMELPFGEASLRALMRRVLADEPQPLHARCRVSRQLSAIVSKAMAREPAARYPTARAFADDLAAFLHGGSVSARASTWLTRLPRLASRHVTAPVAVLGVITLTSLALMVKVSNQARVVQAGSSPTAARDLLRRALLWEFAEEREEGAGELDPLERVEPLAEVAHADPFVLFPRVRVHLAVLAAERGDATEARRRVAELEEAGWEFETLRWILDGLEARRSGPGSVRPSAAYPPQSLVNDVDRYYLLRACPRDSGADVPTPARLDTNPVYGAPVLFLQSLRRAEGHPRDLAGALEGLRRVQALVPNHPVVMAELLRRSCEYVREQSWQGERARRYLAPLAHVAAATAETRPAYPGFWMAHEALLERLGDPPALAGTLEPNP